MAKKNEDYLSHIAKMDESEILADVPKVEPIVFFFNPDCPISADC